MRIRVFMVIIGLLAAVCAFAKGKDDPAALIAQCDAQYYFPTQAGVQDLAVDLTIQELQSSPIGKLAKVSYYYVNEERQRFEITNVPDQYAKFRDDLAGLVEPLSNYLVPLPSALTFNGLNLRVDRVSRQLVGRPDTTYFMVVGTAKDAGALVHEYHMLLDSAGLTVQAESVLKDGSKLTARIENIKIGDRWYYHTVTTRMMVSGLPQWRVMTIDYTQVDGFTVPSTITIQNRNTVNKPVDGAQDWTITLANYRINKGVAAQQLPPPPAKPADTPAAPAAPAK